MKSVSEKNIISTIKLLFFIKINYNQLKKNKPNFRNKILYILYDYYLNVML